MCKMFKAVYPIEKRGGVSNSKNCCIVYFLKVIPVTGDRGIVLVLRGEFGLAKKLRSTFDNSPALPESLPDFNGCPSVNHTTTKERRKHRIKNLTGGKIYEIKNYRKEYYINRRD